MPERRPGRLLFITWQVLPSGRQGRGSVEATFIFSRHEWVDFHAWLAVIAVVLLVIHIALHWSWIVATTKRLRQRI
ncbi:DUF4405 domain-containing protein [Neomoorella humiferrea]|uniref:DUF4405 domain-containing protein n=1 Tax=Neomoorella humiferrea TaxID=676965 RepID=UPI000D047222|nr:DUF4405 domain-containing protein [Moorella humiferrea]